MSILSVHDLQGISAYNNTIRIPTGHNLEAFGSLTANGNLKIPVWSSESRPSTNLEVGLIGYNTTTKLLELYVGPQNPEDTDPNNAWAALTVDQPSSFAFPPAYISLIDSFSTKYYVSTDGSDGNPGTENSPFLTIDKALQVAGNNTAIVMKEGTYSIINNGPGSYGERMFYTTSSVSIIGEPGKVIITEASNKGARDNHVFGMQNSGCKIYGLVIRRNNEGRTNNYSNAMWGFDASASFGEVYNCVIQEMNANGQMSHVYDNSGTGGGKLYNCTIVASAWQTAYTCGSTNLTQNTALTSSNTFNLCGTSTNNVNSASINQVTYELTNYSNTTYGVYSGTYAWPSL